MTVFAQHIGYRQHDRLEGAGLCESSAARTSGCSTPRAKAIAKVPDRRSGVAIPPHRCELVTGLEGVDASLALVRVELSGIFQVPHPAFVHLLGDPAFVADVRVSAALVERGENTLHLRRAITCLCEPGAIGLMLFDVRHGVRATDIRQAGAGRARIAPGGRVQRAPRPDPRPPGSCGSVRPLRVLPGDFGVFGSGRRLVARPGLSGGIADLCRKAACRKIIDIGLIPAATQFGHASV